MTFVHRAPRALEVAGASIAYDVKDLGPAGLVFLPGWCCPRSDWYQIADALPEWSAMMIDLPGQGQSSSGRAQWRMADLGAAIAELVRLHGWSDVTLIGHSMGGAVAVEAAIALGPEARRVICVDSLTYDAFYTRQDEAYIEAALRPYENDFPGAMQTLVYDLFVDKGQHALITQIATTMASAPQEEALAGLRTLLEWDRDDALSRCPAPIDIISAAAYLDPQVAAHLGRRARIAPVELGGHFFLLEQPEATAGQIDAVLIRD